MYHYLAALLPFYRSVVAIFISISISISSTISLHTNLYMDITGKLACFSINKFQLSSNPRTAEYRHLVF